MGHRAAVAALCGLLVFGAALPASAATVSVVQTGINPLRGNAVDSSGRLWVPYSRPVGGGAAVVETSVARQVAGTGHGCVIATWSCSTVDKNANSSEVSIAAGPAGAVWLAFYVTNPRGVSALKVARYVGTGGTGCSSPQWSCEIVVKNQSFFRTESAPGIAVLADGTPVVAFATGTTAKPATSMMIARRTAGAGCIDAAWTCSLVEHARGAYTGFPAVVTQSSGEIDVAYLTTGGDVRVANTQAGAPPLRGCAADFHCQTISTYDTSAMFPSVTLTLGPHHRLWLAFPAYDLAHTSSFVGLAYQSPSGSGCSAARWECQNVDAWGSAFALNYASVAFDSLGHAFVAYQDFSFRSLRVAEQVGSAACVTNASPGWSCSTIDSDPAGMFGYFPTIARTGSTLSITYGDELPIGQELRVATL